MFLLYFHYCAGYNLNNMATSRHDADKENTHKTRIPLPKDPLPALPSHLLEDSKKNLEIPKRCPLRTLLAQNIPKPGPSKVVPLKPRIPLKIDTKHVTLRQRSEDLDWHYTVFKDRTEDKDASVISISDDEKYLDDKKSRKYFVDNIKKNTLGVNAATPNLQECLESNRIKNIKRSLKRPHSRELQGLSPPAPSKQGKDEEKVKKRLQFNESLQERLGTPDFWKRSYMRCLNRDYSVDMFEYLLAVERKPLDVPRTASVPRACVINWLMKVNGSSGNPAVVQTACWYLDSILGTGHVQVERLQLVAAACYWIAQKLNGPVMPAMRLKFPPQPVVAQEFINYLAWWCAGDGAGEIEVAATFLAMCGMMVDRFLCDEYPSVIAVAAVRNAVLLLRRRELLARLHESNIFKIAEKKATSLTYTCALLRRAVRTVGAPMYEYKAPLEHYGTPPNYIAQKIIKASNDLAAMELRVSGRS
ncbi:hypothetical protein HF086_004289 [Spodoptera exigua]|uniref:Cyclin N-terminal domain-containing protein n=1 Tax=Spodoptera exigua TaxID=7107 RepID=A0A922SP06_SPOEX|nr:hypothetical protein HF086_004289 [Spodoptera exigua]